jgi:hypothetical protein
MALVTFTTPIENVNSIVSHYQLTSFSYDGTTLYFESATYNNVTFAANYATVNWADIALDNYKITALDKLRRLYGGVVGGRGTVQGNDVVISQENALMLLISQGAFTDITLPSIGQNVTINQLNAHSFTSSFLTLYFQRYAAYISAINAVYDSLTINAVDAAVAAYEALIA